MGNDYTQGANIENIRVSSSAWDNWYDTSPSTGNHLAGNDLNNMISGSCRADTVWSNAGNDSIYGGSGIGSLAGGNDNDVGQGGDGSDTILCDDAGDDILNGNNGADSIRGGTGVDWIIGEAGNDYLDGGLGADKLTGGAGNDLHILDSAADTVIELAGGGIDEVRTYASSYTLGAEVENLMHLGRARRGTSAPSEQQEHRRHGHGPDLGHGGQ